MLSDFVSDVMKTWKHGNIEIRKHRNMGTWEQRNMET